MGLIELLTNLVNDKDPLLFLVLLILAYPFALIFLVARNASYQKKDRIETEQKPTNVAAAPRVVSLKNCPPHKWNHTETFNIYGDKVWVIVCELCKQRAGRLGGGDDSFY